jgi:hypothetical protein
VLTSVTVLGAACGARTELGAIERDAANTQDATTSDSSADVLALADAPDEEAATLRDVVEECIPRFGKCTTSADCCPPYDCGFGNTCGGVAPPYGGSPLPDDACASTPVDDQRAVLFLR